MGQAGKLNRQIFIEQTTQAKDTFQNVQNQWLPFDEDRAEFQALGADSFQTNWKRYGETTARFRLRFRQDIDPAIHRIVMYDDRFSPPTVSVWKISPPYDLKGKQREMFIEASEIKGTDADVN